MKPTIKTLIPKQVFQDSNGQDVIFHEVCETTCIDLFKTVKGNRSKKAVNIDKMGISVKQIGVIRDVIVFRYNYNYYTGDGQHLTEVLKRLGGTVPIRFKLIDVETERQMFEMVALINGSQLRLSLPEYIKGWAEYNPEYNILLNFKKEFGITYRVLATILTGLKSKAIEAIQKGEFSVVNIETAKLKIKMVYDFKVEVGKKLDAYGVDGLIKFIDTIGIDTYVNQKKPFMAKAKALFKEYGFENKNFGRTDDYVNFFNEVYSKM
jgi:hypothetical protein